MDEFRFFPKVSEIAHKGVVGLVGTSTVAESVALMGQSNLSDIIFSYDGGYSIFTVDDLLNFQRHKRDLSTRLCDLVTTRLRCVPEDTNVLELLQEFDNSSSRYLGVTDQNGELVGIVSYTDVLDSIDPAVMMERRTLGEILTSHRIELIDADAPTDEALYLLDTVEDAVLVTEDGQLSGILTTKDIVRIINQHSDTTVPVKQYMTAPVQTVSKRETVKGAIAYLKDRKFKRAIVIDDDTGRVLGVISQRDLIQSTYGRWADLVKLHANELNELVRLLEAKTQRLQEESLTDPLTGVGNRRSIGQALEAEVGRYYRRKNLPFSLLMLDVDSFKKINDSMGHVFGDAVLTHLCRTVKGMIRVSDSMGRWGGEEFLILLPETALATAEVFAQRIRGQIEAARFQNNVITVSIGVAEYAEGESIDSLVARADEALYRAKNEGRNRVVRAE